jgi:hypothetical protein
MDILIQSLLQKARQFNASLHIRYSAQPDRAGESTGPERHHASSDATGGCVGMTSYVIIRREYSYLEPLIRSMFEEAEDVKVLIDRRFEDRRDAPTRSEKGEPHSAVDRRSSTPMLDILIKMQS